MPSKKPIGTKESAARRPLTRPPLEDFKKMMGFKQNAKSEKVLRSGYGRNVYDAEDYGTTLHGHGGQTQEEHAPPPAGLHFVPDHSHHGHPESAPEIGFVTKIFRPQDSAHHFQQSESCMDTEHSGSSLEEDAESYLGGYGGSLVANVSARETLRGDFKIGDCKSLKHSHASKTRRHEQNPEVDSDFQPDAAQVFSEVRNVKATAPPPQELSSDDSMDEDEHHREPPVYPPDAPGTRRRRYDQKTESDEGYSPARPPRASSNKRHKQSQPQNNEMYSAIHDRVGDKSREAPYSSAFIVEAECRPSWDQPPVALKPPQTAVGSRTDYGQNRLPTPQRYPSTIKSASRHGPRPPRQTQQVLKYSYQIESATVLTPRGNWTIPMYIFFFIGLSILFCFKYSGFFSTGTTQKSGLNVTDVIMDLRSEFPNQPRMSFRVIHSAIKNVALPEPKAPAIIVLLAANGSEATCDRFAHRLVNSLSSPDHIAQISGKDYEAQNVHFAKKDIDDMINKTLRNDRMGAVLVDGLDLIPGDAALIFHTYCDHENAPFKRAVYVMTVSYGKTIPSDSDPKSWDKALQDHLYSAWADVGVDQVSPLLSRLTVSVAAITDRNM